MVSNFPAIVKRFLKDLPTDDYPVLDTFTFVSCWMSFVMDQSQSSMRDLFKRLNVRGIDMDISTRVNAPKWGVFRSIETRIANLIVIID